MDDLSKQLTRSYIKRTTKSKWYEKTNHNNNQFWNLLPKALSILNRYAKNSQIIFVNSKNIGAKSNIYNLSAFLSGSQQKTKNTRSHKSTKNWKPISLKANAIRPSNQTPIKCWPLKIATEKSPWNSFFESLLPPTTALYTDRHFTSLHRRSVYIELM